MGLHKIICASIVKFNLLQDYGHIWDQRACSCGVLVYVLIESLTEAFKDTIYNPSHWNTIQCQIILQ